MGLEPIKELQTHSIDTALRNSLWNAFYETIWRTALKAPLDYEGKRNIYLYDWADTFWISVLKDYLKYPTDERFLASECQERLKSFFLDTVEWYEIYNFLEFVCKSQCLKQYQLKKFYEACNQVLEREMAGYRIIDGLITPITNSIEIVSIEEAVKSPYEYANQHLHSALEKLSDRDNPDYRNSIKESISAVEAICRKLTDESTLDRALKKIENKLDINHQFKQGLEKLYHYTNGESGIRHALIDEGQPSFDEAKFMLVACSAVVNYLTAKASVLND